LYETMQHAKHWLRPALAVLLALLMCAGVMAGAAETPAPPRTLIPIGHTVGIKLFSKGVMVVKLPEDRTPARECGLKTGDVILKCGGIAVSSTEQFQALLQRQAVSPPICRSAERGGM